MNELLKALSSNPIAITILIISFGIIVISIVLTYLIAFFQGREIVFWPPKIGAKPDKKPHDKIQHITNQHTTISAVDFFVKWETISPMFKEQLNTAETVQMVAVANPTLLTTMEDKFRQLVSRGGKIQCVYVKPTGHAVKMVAERSYGAECNNVKAVYNLIMSALNTMRAIGKNKDNVQVKLMDHLPSAVITIIDQQKSEGVIYVTLYGYRQFYLERPTFVLHKEQHKQWFDFYASVFEEMWKSDEGQLLDLSKEFIPDNNESLTT